MSSAVAGTAPSTVSGNGDYVLLVEDDLDVGALLRHHLEALGHDVVHVTTAAQALDHLAERSPGLAVVDILLPGPDGRTVIRRLQGSPRYAGCRIVVTSIVDRDDLGVEVDAVLSKPFGRQDIVAALQRAGVRPAGGAA